MDGENLLSFEVGSLFLQRAEEFSSLPKFDYPETSIFAPKMDGLEDEFPFGASWQVLLLLVLGVRVPQSIFT